ncbi:MAG: hypothetical protein QOG83_633, partial [Alphaproteobacteria bacterium]|nr:hypothetical protein [Alphaproteobacteria bacterium]
DEADRNDGAQAASSRHGAAVRDANSCRDRRCRCRCGRRHGSRRHGSRHGAPETRDGRRRNIRPARRRAVMVASARSNSRRSASTASVIGILRRAPVPPARAADHDRLSHRRAVLATAPVVAPPRPCGRGGTRHRTMLVSFSSTGPPGDALAGVRVRQHRIKYARTIGASDAAAVATVVMTLMGGQPCFTTARSMPQRWR